MNCANAVNFELNSLNTWLLANKLFLNLDKTKYMIIRNQGIVTDLDLHISNATIQRTNVHKFLGVEIDDCLTFTSHINKLKSKISRNVGIMRKIRDLIPLSVMRSLHFALISSHVSYAILSYGFSSPTAIGRLSKFIDKSIKLTLNVERITPELCKINKLFNFQSCLK